MNSMEIAKLIADRKAALKIDTDIMARRPAGEPRTAWRVENDSPGRGPVLDLVDTSKKSRRKLMLSFVDGMDAWIWRLRPDGSGALVDRIDLTAIDAAACLARFEIA